CTCDLRLWAVLWQLPERVYLQVAAWQVGGNAALRVSALRGFDTSLPQRARTELADSSRKVPIVQEAHIAALPADRTAHGLALSWLLHASWLDSRDAEMRRARLPAAGLDLHRCGNQVASRRADSARAGSGNFVQPGGSSE